MPNVVFPRVSQITKGRRNLIEVISQQFPTDDASLNETWFISGNTSTRPFAEVYRRMWEESGNKTRLFILNKAPFVSEAERLRDALLSEETCPRMIIYVGGQTIGDVTKYSVRMVNDLLRLEQQPIVFGGIITSLTSDGIYSPGASLRDDNTGLPVSKTCEAPAFIVGHERTLLRQPYMMKCACVGDMLAKVSSLWDYRHSCHVQGIQPNDFASDLTESSYQPFLERGDDLKADYLHKESSIKEMFRAVQLSGLAMQIQDSTQACSGSEHIGQKWLDDFVIEYDSMADKRIKQSPLHGIGVLPMTIITAYMQGQVINAEKIKRIANTLDIPYMSVGLQEFSAQFIQELITTCLVIGIGYRCPKYIAYQCKRSVEALSNKKNIRKPDDERITILDEPEFELLSQRVKHAAIDAGLFDPDLKSSEDQTSKVAKQALKKIRIRAWTRLKRSIDEAVDSETGELVANELRRVFGLSLTYPSKKNAKGKRNDIQRQD